MSQPGPKSANAAAAMAAEQLVLARYPAYEDYSNASNEWIEQRQRETLPVKGRGNSGAKKMFPIQLYRMLEAVDGTPHSILIRWLPHGRAFVVLETNRFTTEVLPHYFPSQSKFTSFQRQLNIYGFLRCVCVDDGYYHELFLRGRPVLATLIPRLPHGHYTTRRTFDPDSEPDFYAMTWLPDVPNRPEALANDGNDAHSSVLSHLLPMATANVQPSLPPSSQMPRPERRYHRPTASSARRGTPSLGSGIEPRSPTKRSNAELNTLVANSAVDASAAVDPEALKRNATNNIIPNHLGLPANDPVTELLLAAAAGVPMYSAHHDAMQQPSSDQSQSPTKRTRAASSPSYSLVTNVHHATAASSMRTANSDTHQPLDALEATQVSIQLETTHQHGIVTSASHATTTTAAYKDTTDRVGSTTDSNVHQHVGLNQTLPRDCNQPYNVTGDSVVMTATAATTTEAVSLVAPEASVQPAQLDRSQLPQSNSNPKSSSTTFRRELVDWGDVPPDVKDGGNLETNSSSEDELAEWAEFLNDVNLDD